MATPYWSLSLVALGALLAVLAGKRGRVVRKSTLYGSLGWLSLCALVLYITQRMG